jgi:hypothetical protein
MITEVRITAASPHCLCICIASDWVSRRKIKPCSYRHAGTKEDRYSSYSFLTSTLGGASGQRYASATLYPRYPLDSEAGWASGLVWTQRLCLYRGSNLGSPVCSQTRYWFRDVLGQLPARTWIFWLCSAVTACELLVTCIKANHDHFRYPFWFCR